MTKKTRCVQFDVDGVLADFTYDFTTLMSVHGSPIQPRSTKQQQVWDFVDYPKEALRKAWSEIANSKTFWLELDPFVGPLDVARIVELNSAVPTYFVTARPGDNAKRQTEDWLIKLGVHNPCVIMSSKKGDVAKAVGASHAIDDKAGNAIYTAYQAPDCASYIVDYPYNQFDDQTVGSKVVRVPHVSTFLEDCIRGL